MPTLTDAQKQSFITDGYIIIPSLIPPDLVDAAEQQVDEALASKHSTTDHDRQDGNNNLPTFYHARTSNEVLSLYSDTLLQDAVHDLLGGNLQIRDCGAQLACTFPGDTSVGMDDVPDKKQWHVDASHGRYAVIAADFLVLAGVALSEGQDVDENRGQLVVFPGSHLITHAKLQHLISNTKNVAQVMQQFRNACLDVGEPKRVLLRRGDVVIAHQRLAHVAGKNSHSVLTRKNVYFRVENTNFASFAHAYVTSPHPWTSFSGLAQLIPNTQIPSDDIPNICKLLAAHGTESGIQLVEGQVEQFVKQGYVVLKNILNERLCEKALHKVNNAMNNGKYKTVGNGDLVFNTHVGCGLALTDVLFGSGIVNAVESLLGVSNVVLLDSKADVVVKELKDGNKDETVRKGGWEIGIGKGRFWRRGMDHMVRVAVAVTDGLQIDENRGQIIVWPASHLKTHELMRSVFTENEEEGRAHAYREAKRRLKCGEGHRLVMNKGDAVIMHQRLATTLTDNVVTQDPSIILQFPLQSVNFYEILDDFQTASHPFTGFEAIQQFI